MLGDVLDNFKIRALCGFLLILCLKVQRHSVAGAQKKFQVQYSTLVMYNVHIGSSIL